MHLEQHKNCKHGEKLESWYNIIDHAICTQWFISMWVGRFCYIDFDNTFSNQLSDFLHMGSVNQGVHFVYTSSLILFTCNHKPMNQNGSEMKGSGKSTHHHNYKWNQCETAS